MACLAVSGESDAEPGAFLTGANSSCRCTSSSATRLARGKVSKMNSSSLTPCVLRWPCDGRLFILLATQSPCTAGAVLV